MIYIRYSGLYDRFFYAFYKTSPVNFLTSEDFCENVFTQNKHHHVSVYMVYFDKFKVFSYISKSMLRIYNCTIKKTLVIKFHKIKDKV